MPTKILVLLNGEPLVGAKVIAGELGALERETDEDGMVALPELDPSYVGYTEVSVEAAGIFATAKVFIRGNQTTEVDLGERA